MFWLSILFKNIYNPHLNLFKAAESVALLLKKARETVPEESWQHTPLALKATAGLRLLPELEAEAILEKVS